MEGESVYTNFVNFSMSVIGVPHVTAVFENIPQEKFGEVAVHFQELPLVHNRLNRDFNVNTCRLFLASQRIQNR